MSMNAQARLWYGIWNPTVEERVRLEVEEPPGNPYGEKVVDGVMIEFFHVFDNRIGLGGTVAHSWWAENDEPIDQAAFDRVKAAVDKFFDEFGVAGERGLYLTADYS